MTYFQKVLDKLVGLPVAAHIGSIVKSVVVGVITVVAASTGSGKTMTVPGALADNSDHQIVVLVPSRFLALDAAYNVAELAGIKIGDQVGYALGQMGGENSKRSDQTKVLYCTNGYALHSGLINSGRTFVIDEVHEANEDISLVRAILRERKKSDPSIRIVEMSATVDAQAQARYWQDISQTEVYAIASRALECDFVHELPVRADGNKDRSAEEIAVDLLGQGRKGIAVFRPGVKEVEATVEEIKKLLAAQGIHDVEVFGIHGGTPSDERRAARRAPKDGKRKIIVGTNVIESGVNLRWLDAGISDGYRKIPYHRDDTGAGALILEDIPQAGLLQQMGRINRDPAATGFERGLFILHAKKPFEARRPQNGPAIQRTCLNATIFQAACLGFNPTKLKWDITSTVHMAALLPRMEQAKQELIRLQLVNEDWSLTEEGEFIKRLPISPETGAMLCEAKKLDEQRMRDSKKQPRVMRDMVIIAAIAESHGLREDIKMGHKGDQHRTSDLIDAMNAFRTIRKDPIAQKVLDTTEEFLDSATDEQLAVIQQERAELKTLCLKYNVSLNGFVEVAKISDEIASRLSENDRGLRFDARHEDDKYDAERYGELQRCILNGHANRLFIQENGGLRDLLRDYGKQRSDFGQPYNGYIPGRDSIVLPPQEGALMVGKLREFPSGKQGGDAPLLALTEMTAIPPEVFIDWAVARAAHHQPLLADGVIENQVLSAVYDGKAKFELNVSPAARAKASQLTDAIPTRNREGKKAPTGKKIL